MGLAATPSARGEPPLILMVGADDQLAKLAAAARAVLSDTGLEVRAIGDPTQALEILQNERVDVIVAADALPKMAGADLLAQVRHRFPATARVLATTQDLVPADQLQGADCALLTRPGDPDHLAGCLHGALESRAQQCVYQRWRESHGGRSRVQLEQCFEDSLAQMWMAFQPIVSRVDGTIIAHEALMRTHAESLRSPPEILGAAAELDRLFDLERRVRERIAAQILEGPPDLLYFVNLHPASLTDDLLYSDDDPLVSCAPRVVLEITERASLHDVSDIVNRIQSLRDRGYLIAVDDLGAGYAGLTTFVTLRPDFVKFDMLLVRDIHKSLTNSRLVKALSEICKDIGVLTIAEGIESVDERDHVLDLGCDLLQGYLYGRPSSELC